MSTALPGPALVTGQPSSPAAWGLQEVPMSPVGRFEASQQVELLMLDQRLHLQPLHTLQHTWKGLPNPLPGDIPGISSVPVLCWLPSQPLQVHGTKQPLKDRAASPPLLSFPPASRNAALGGCFRSKLVFPAALRPILPCRASPHPWQCQGSPG